MPIFRQKKQPKKGAKMGSQKTPKNQIEKQALEELVFYQPLTGLITSRRTGRDLGTSTKNGIRICVDGAMVLAHVLAWNYQVGIIPEGFYISHNNGIKTDNRFQNLSIRRCSEFKKVQAEQTSDGDCFWNYETKKWDVVIKTESHFEGFESLEEAKKMAETFRDAATALGVGISKI